MEFESVQKDRKNGVQRSMNYNPCNDVRLIGSPGIKDYSKVYKISENGVTVLRIPIFVYNHYKKTNERVIITMFGRQIDEQHPKGGLAEYFLKHASTKIRYEFYGYVSCYKTNGNVPSLKMEIVINNFLMINVTTTEQKAAILTPKPTVTFEKAFNADEAVKAKEDKAESEEESISEQEVMEEAQKAKRTKAKRVKKNVEGMEESEIEDMFAKYTELAESLNLADAESEGISGYGTQESNTE